MRKNLPLFLIALSTSSLLAQTPATPVLVVPAQVQTSAAKLTTSATKPSSTSTPAPAQAQPFQLLHPPKVLPAAVELIGAGEVQRGSCREC